MTEEENALALAYLQKIERSLDSYLEEAREWKRRAPKIGQRPVDVFSRLDRLEIRIERIERHLEIDGVH